MLECPTPHSDVSHLNQLWLLGEQKKAEREGEGEGALPIGNHYREHSSSILLPDLAASTPQ